MNIKHETIHCNNTGAECEVAIVAQYFSPNYEKKSGKSLKSMKIKRKKMEFFNYRILHRYPFLLPLLQSTATLSSLFLLSAIRN